MSSGGLGGRSEGLGTTARSEIGEIREPPNVVVAARRDGLEVLHLYTGRPLTQLPLPSASAHGDVNGDGSVDHVIGLSSEETTAAVAAEEAERQQAAAGLESHSPESVDAAPEAGGAKTNAQPARGGRRGRKHAAPRQGLGKHADRPTCLGLCTSGVPVQDALWNASVCTSSHARGRHHRHKGARGGRAGGFGVAKPLLVSSPGLLGGSQLDTLFLASDGRVTGVGPDGSMRWQVQSDAAWRVLPDTGAPTDGNFLPSLTLFLPTRDAAPLVVALGEFSVCIVSPAQEKLLVCQRIPHSPVAPPVVGDFSADGVADLIIPCATAHLGLRVSTGAGGLVAKLLFCFLGLAVALAVIVRYGEGMYE